MFKLTMRRGQSNLSIVFILVSCEEKDYYRAVSVGQLSLDCRSYCGRRRRMQGCDCISHVICKSAVSFSMFSTVFSNYGKHYWLFR